MSRNQVGSTNNNVHHSPVIWFASVFDGQMQNTCIYGRAHVIFYFCFTDLKKAN
jgi:hypothetical protein